MEGRGITEKKSFTFYIIQILNFKITILYPLKKILAPPLSKIYYKHEECQGCHLTSLDQNKNLSLIEECLLPTTTSVFHFLIKI